MRTDDGDFTDPASRAPWAKGGARPPTTLSGKAGTAPEDGAARNSRAGSVFGVLIVLAIAGVFTMLAFSNWNDAPEVPIDSGLRAISIGRVLMPVFDVLLLLKLAGSLASRRTEEMLAAAPRAAIGATVAGLVLISAALEASGDLRRAAIKVFGQVHGGHPAAPLKSAQVVPAPAQAPSVPEVARTCNAARGLHAAAALGCDEKLRALLSSQLPMLETRNRQGQSPLAVAVLNGRLGVAELLLKVGADANATITFAAGRRPNASGLQQAQRPELAEGSTPLIMAQDAAMAALLLRFGADTKAKNSYGWSALFYYTHHGSVEMIETLLSAGADINDMANVDPSHAGSTPLMWAAYMNRIAQLQALLRHQPRLDIRDRAGKTALDYARGFGHQEAIRLLTDAATASR